MSPAPSKYRWGSLVAAAIVCGLAFFPDVVRLDRWTPFAQLVAFRPLVVAGGLVVGIGAGLVRRFRPFAVVVTLTALVGAALVAGRLTGGGASSAASGGGSVAVLTANVQASTADIDAVAATVRRHEPDLVVLPEADARFRKRLQASLTGASYRGKTAAVGPSPVAATSLLVSSELGPVRFGSLSRSTFGGVTATGGELGKVRVVAFHASPPLPFSTMRQWRQDLSLLSQWCRTPSRPAIVAGDFNASLDHSAFRVQTRGCVDAAAALGEGVRGTWPSGIPAWLGSQIDHVLTTPQIQPDGISFLTVAGTDHRAVLARLTVRTG